MDQPRFPEGTPEYDAYRAELAVELAKFAAGEAPYEFDATDLDDGGRAARALGIDMPKPLAPKMKRALELVCAGRGHAADGRTLAALVKRKLITEAQYRSDHRLTEAGRKIVAGEN